LAIAPFDAARAKQHQQAWADYLGLPVEMTNSIGMKLILIPPGEFDMGSTQEEVDRLLGDAKRGTLPQGYANLLPREIPRHRVRITTAFYLGVHEVTQRQYERAIRSNPSEFKESGPDAPVETVSWDDTAEFCRRLSGLVEEKASEYRLPTEAEWEYACRAGTTTQYSFGDDTARLGEYAWHGDNSDKRAHPVGQKMRNAWGLHDMHGNVWEWCQDWYAQDYYAGSPTGDPRGPEQGADRVSRGGGWNRRSQYCRSACRARYAPSGRNGSLGFRVALEIPLALAGSARIKSQESAGGAPRGTAAPKRVKAPQSSLTPADTAQSTSGPKDIPELLQRNRDAWLQRDLSPSQNLCWPDCYLGASAHHQTQELQTEDANDDPGPRDEFLRSIDEIVPLSEPPMYEVQGPLAVMRGKTVRYRLGDEWHTVEALSVVMQRDGQWRWAFGMGGDWGMTSADRFDPNKSDHVALQRLLDQAGEAWVRKDAEAIRKLMHPENRYM